MAGKPDYQFEGCISECYFSCRGNARRRSVSFRINMAVFNELIQQACVYCGSPPRNKIKRKGFTFLYQGLDRMDNSRGYVPGNVVSCCAECNSIKGKNLSHSEMIEVAQLLKKLRAR